MTIYLHLGICHSTGEARPIHISESENIIEYDLFPNYQAVFIVGTSRKREISVN